MSKKNPFVLEEIINNIPYFVFWKDTELNYIGVNTHFAKSAGFQSAEDMIGKCDFDCCWTKSEAEFFRKIDREVMASKKPMLNIEEPQKQLDGSSRTLLTSKVPLFNESGDVVGLLGIYADITDRKELENEKDEALKELKKIQQILVHQEKMKSLGEMAGGIAHEINNPLTVISTQASIIKKILQNGEDFHKIEGACDRILRTVNRCSNIIKNLQNFSRDSEKVDIELSDTKKIVDTVMTLVTARGRSQEIPIHWEAKAVPLLCKCLSVEQSLLNLVNNAFDEVEKNGMGEVVVRSFSCGERSGIEVLNSGPPVPMEIQENFFQPFFTTKEIGRGTGLGLSTSKGLIEKCGGELTFFRSGEMNVFRIAFAKVDSESDQPEAKERTIRIVAVDDEIDLVDAMKGIFEISLPCKVFGFTEPERALEFIQQNDIDLVVSDIRMPGMDGVALLKEIKRVDPETPLVVLMSGYSSYSEDDLEAIGANHFFAKPINCDKFIDYVKREILSKEADPNRGNTPSGKVA